MKNVVPPITEDRPTPEQFGLFPVSLDDYWAGFKTVYRPLMLDAASDMTDRAVHYDRGRENGTLVGACGAIALLGVPNEQGLPEDVVVFSLGANVKESDKVPKFCAEWWVTDDADSLLERHGEGNVEILDIGTATPTILKTVHKVMGTDKFDTLCPCYGCIIKLSMNRAISSSTGIHMRRMDPAGNVEASRGMGLLVQDFSGIPAPRVSDRIKQLEREGRSLQPVVRRHEPRRRGLVPRAA